MNDLHEMAANSREAAWTLAASSLETRNAALLRMAETLENHQADIFAANAADIHQAEADGLAAPLLGRLKFREEKLRAVTDGLRALAALPDPIGATTMTHEITPGLKMYRVTCPIGVIGVIFARRPDALVQIASLALKSGNAVLLKGGREADRTNAVLCGALREAAADVGLPADFAQLLHSREDVAAMLDEGVAAYIRRKGLWNPTARKSALTAQIAADPENTALYMERGKLHYRLNEWGAALNDFNRVLQADDSHAEARQYAQMVQEILEFRYKDI